MLKTHGFKVCIIMVVTIVKIGIVVIVVRVTLLYYDTRIPYHSQ